MGAVGTCSANCWQAVMVEFQKMNQVQCASCEWNNGDNSKTLKPKELRTELPYKFIHTKNHERARVTNKQVQL